jgi:hypothetical protein
VPACVLCLFACAVLLLYCCCLMLLCTDSIAFTRYQMQAMFELETATLTPVFNAEVSGWKHHLGYDRGIDGTDCLWILFCNGAGVRIICYLVMILTDRDKQI